jgi:parallel beta-helix repeat protein
MLEIIITVIPVLILLLFVWWIIKRISGTNPPRKNLARDFEASFEGLKIPKAATSMRWIPRESIRSLRAVWDVEGPGIKVDAHEGAIILPASVLNELTMTSFEIEDPDGFLESKAPLPDFRDWEWRGDIGRGALISEQPPDQVTKAAKSNRNSGVVIVVGGIITCLLWLLIGPMTPGISVVCPVLFILGFVIGGAMIFSWSRPTPIGIYENGIETPILFGQGMFIPWGVFTSCDEQTIVDKPHFYVKGPGWLGASIKPEFPKYEEIKDFISERVGDPRYDSKEWHLHRLKWFTIFQVVLALTFGTVSVLPGLLYLDLMPEGVENPIQGAILIAVMVWSVLYAVNLLIFVRPKTWFVPKRRFSIIFTTTILAFLIITMTFLILDGGIDDSIFRSEVLESEDPGNSIIAPGVYDGENILATNTVTVRHGEVLTITNSTVTFDPAPGLDYGIWVGPGGRLQLKNVTLGSVDNGVGFAFEIHGSARIEDCIIRSLAKNPDQINGDGGIEVYSDDVVVLNTTFLRPLSQGLMLIDSSPMVINCTFNDSVDDGIEIHGGSPLIEDCRFERCEFAIVMWRSNATVKRCTFVRNGEGIYISGSSPTIEDCSFINTDGSAIAYMKGTTPVLTNNTYSGNKDDVVESESEESYICTSCYAIAYILPILAIVHLWNLSRKLPRPPLEY